MSFALMSLVRRSTSTSRFSSIPTLFPNGCRHRQAFDERQRQIEAIKAIAAIRGVQESRPRQWPRAVRTMGGLKFQRTAGEYSIMLTSPSRLSRVGPTQCIVCLGKKRLAYENRIRPFHSFWWPEKAFPTGNIYREDELIVHLYYC